MAIWKACRYCSGILYMFWERGEGWNVGVTLLVGSNMLSGCLRLLACFLWFLLSIH